MSKKTDKTGRNYLDLIPVHNDKYTWDESEDGLVTIYQENTGLMNRLAQKFADRPEVSQIHLDELGSFIWCSIDGSRSVNDIAGLVRDEFGEKAEPLYNRLVQYMHTLEAYEFVLMR